MVGVGLALLTSVRYATWGPEGPVGGWLLLVPYLIIVAAVTGILIARGTFSWVRGGRWTCFAIWVGLLIAFSVSGYYSMFETETKYEQFAAPAGRCRLFEPSRPFILSMTENALLWPANTSFQSLLAISTDRTMLKVHSIAENTPF